MRHHADVVGDVKLGRDAEPHVCAGLHVVLARLGVLRIITAKDHAVAYARAVNVVVVGRLRPQRVGRDVFAPQREMAEELRANAHVAMHLEHRPSGRPPIFGEHVRVALAPIAVCDRLGLVSRLRLHRCGATSFRRHHRRRLDHRWVFRGRRLGLRLGRLLRGGIRGE